MTLCLCSQLSHQLNRGVFRYEEHIKRARAAAASSEEAKKKTDSLCAELKGMGEKVTELQEDVLAKDALLARSKTVQAASEARIKELEAQVEKGKKAIDKWGIHSSALAKELAGAKARIKNNDRDLVNAREEIAKLKRSAKAEKDRAVLAARKASSMKYRE